MVLDFILEVQDFWRLILQPFRIYSRIDLNLQSIKCFGSFNYGHLIIRLYILCIEIIVVSPSLHSLDNIYELNAPMWSIMGKRLVIVKAFNHLAPAVDFHSSCYCVPIRSGRHWVKLLTQSFNIKEF